MSDTGRLHQLVHMWRFDDDADRRDFWERLYADSDSIAIVGKVRPLLETQEVQLLRPAPWGPHPSIGHWAWIRFLVRILTIGDNLGDRCRERDLEITYCGSLCVARIFSV